jgi:hypothetical protein
MKKTLRKNNLNFVKDVPMTYVNLITTVIILSEKNNEAVIAYCPLAWIRPLPPPSLSCSLH